MRLGKTLLICTLVLLILNHSHAYSYSTGVEEGDEISIDYVGTKESDGTVFDSTEGTGPATFIVSPDRLIEGFYEGVLRMKIGQEKLITIPPEKGYTDPNHELYGETLIFDVLLHDVLNYDSSTDISYPEVSSDNDTSNNDTGLPFNLPVPLLVTTVLPLLIIWAIVARTRKDTLF